MGLSSEKFEKNLRNLRPLLKSFDRHQMKHFARKSGDCLYYTH